jgi:hypothetical protein
MLGGESATANKSFLLLFFKKEVLALIRLLNHRAGISIDFGT